MHKGGLFLLALVAALLVVSGCGDGSDGSGDSAHINTESGSVNGAIPDESEGTPPPPGKVMTVKKAAEKGECFVVQNVQPKGFRQLPPGSPPVSGKHTQPPNQQADGAYLTMPNYEDVLGALDHGRVAIHYAPDLSKKIRAEIKGLYDTMYGGVLLFPDGEMQWAVAATAWDNFLGCPGYNGVGALDAIRAFARATWGHNGSKPVDAFPVEGPTPVEPEEPS
jgi:hypothetical protein